jgi:hypothetical protein
MGQQQHPPVSAHDWPVSPGHPFVSMQHSEPDPPVGALVSEAEAAPDPDSDSDIVSEAVAVLDLDPVNEKERDFVSERDLDWVREAEMDFDWQQLSDPGQT